MKIKLTRNGNISFPEDLQNLTYEEAVGQLNLLEQDEFEQYQADRQSEDILLLNHIDGMVDIYEIEED